jgi:hypothetical protein
LFIGGTLQKDRTTLLVVHLIERRLGLRRYALLSDADYTSERQLADWTIQSLFFRDAEYGRVDRFRKACRRHAGLGVRGDNYFFRPDKGS